MAKKTTADKPRDVHVPLRMSADLEREIEATAAAIHLSKQDTMRHAMKRGLPLLKRLFAATPEELMKLAS